MFKFNNNYTHRYINNKKIISISNNINSKVINKNFLSIPYKSSVYNIDTNVLVGFDNENYSKLYLNDLNAEFKYSAQLFEIELEEFEYIGSLMNMPIVIIMNEFYANDNYEIFYYYKGKNDLFHRFHKENL